MSYTKEIFINVSMGSTRVAILENEVLVELHIDIADHKKMVGNILFNSFAPTYFNIPRKIVQKPY